MARILPTGRRLLALDAILVAWALLWLVLGVRLTAEARGLNQLPNAIDTVGAAVEDFGGALGRLEIPLIAGGAERIGQEVAQAGRGARATAAAARDNIEDLSLLLGASVTLIPTAPLLLLYLPLRLARAREVAALRGFAQGFANDPELERFLAMRAIQSLPYGKLRQISAEPWRDVEEGRCRELAAAELARMGVRPRAP